MTVCSDKLLLQNALADGELDAGHALELEAHMQTCPGCAREWERRDDAGPKRSSTG